MIAFAALCTIGPASSNLAQDPCRPTTGDLSWGVGSINLLGFGDGRSPDTAALGGAASMWDQCGGIPDILTATSGDQTVQVIFYAGGNDGRVPQCGTECGCYSNGVISVFETNAIGLRDCTQTWSSLIAHELGHHLGLGNAGDGCGCVIMGNTACAPAVAGEDCAATDGMWLTPAEETSEPNEDTTDDTPILIDLDRQGFKLTDVSGGVMFEIRPGHGAKRISWTARGAGDGFLVLDLDGNGRIDHGGELFGNYTAQPASTNPNGFKALAIYDSAIFGGNNDGFISEEDPIFADLQIWVDNDHDGSSSPTELRSLSANGITAIHLEYHQSWRRDRHGNTFRYHSWVQTGRSRLSVVDVFLLD